MEPARPLFDEPHDACFACCPTRYSQAFSCVPVQSASQKQSARECDYLRFYAELEQALDAEQVTRDQNEGPRPSQAAA